MSRISTVIPSMPLAFSTSCLRLRANGPPASRQWPMSPLVTETNLTWCPLAAHKAPVPEACSSQSSGCAPKAMIRSLPSPETCATRGCTAENGISTNVRTSRDTPEARYFSVRFILDSPPNSALSLTIHSSSSTPSSAARHPKKFADLAGYIRSSGQIANHSNGVQTDVKQPCCILRCNATDCNQWLFDLFSNLAEVGPGNHRIGICLAGRSKYRPYGDVVSAALPGFQSLCEIVSRVSNDPSGTHDLSGMLDGKILLADMHAISSAKPSNIRTVVYDYTQPMTLPKFDSLLSAGKQLLRICLLGAQLNPG